MPLFKIILCSIINPISDKKCSLYIKGAMVLKRNGASLSKIGDYRIVEFGDEKKILKKYYSKRSLEVVEMPGKLMMPVFYDMHFHWVQDDVRLMPKESLLEWLSKYTWPYEAKFKDISYCKSKANEFREELLKAGTLGGGCYASIHGASVDYALQEFVGDFVVGNVLMTMNSPDYLTQTKMEAVKLVAKKLEKHGKKYAVTPRFAPTTHPEVMKDGARLAKRKKAFVQTHLSETPAEIDYVLSIYKDLPGFEDVESYTEIYERCGTLGPRTIMGHCIHLSDKEIKTLKSTDTTIAHCPTSNAPVNKLGLGSGLFDFKRLEKAGVRWALASDIGGGPYLSMFDVMNSFVSQNKKKKIKEATYTKAIFRSTQAGAEILGIGKRCGNFASGKEGNFILVDVPTLTSSDTAETVLKRLIKSVTKRRSDFSNIVAETVYKGITKYRR